MVRVSLVYNENIISMMFSQTSVGMWEGGRMESFTSTLYMIVSFVEGTELSSTDRGKKGETWRG